MTDPGTPPRSGRFRLTADDMGAAAQLHQLAHMLTPRTIALNLALAVLITTGIFWGMRLPEDRLGRWLEIALWVLAYFAIVLTIVVFVVAPMQGRRQFRQQKSLAEELDFAIDDKSYAVKGASSQSNLPWSDYVKWTENGAMMLLYPSSYFHQILPKRALAPDDVAAIREHLTAAGVPPASPLLRWITSRKASR